jgi:parvulin-like peptidyl-prolyl isomerase
MRIRNIFKKLSILIFLVLLFAIGTIPSFAQDRVIAIVNNDVITQKDLDDFTNFMRMQLSTEYKGIELENKIQSMKLHLLDRLIEDRLILQEAKNQKIGIDQERIKAKIEEIKKRLGSDMEFQRSLKQQGLAQVDLESKIREQLLMYNIIDYKIRSKIIVTPSEVTDFYNKNKNEFKTPEQRDFASISLEDENTIWQISNQLSLGQSFEEVAKKYGLEISKFTVNSTEELKKEIADVIFKLNQGEISKPIKIESLFYIFKVYDIIPPHEQSLAEAQETIRNYLFEKKIQDELAKWLDELKKHSYIKIL